MTIEIKVSLGDAHRTVVVGAGGTLGSAICRAYAAAGATVIALDKDAEACTRVIGELGAQHTAMALDVTDVNAVDRIAVELQQAQPIDSVVYSAGIEFIADVTALSWPAYRDLMDVNLDGAFYVANAFGSQMLASRRRGSLTFISSTAGKRGEPGAAAYCASKFGLLGLVESFAAEVGLAGIRVNAVCPGNVEGPMFESVARGIARRERVPVPVVVERLTREAAEHRLVTPSEVAAVVVWLASPLASAITGESIDVDAGALYR